MGALISAVSETRQWPGARTGVVPFRGPGLGGHKEPDQTAWERLNDRANRADYRADGPSREPCLDHPEVGFICKQWRRTARQRRPNSCRKLLRHHPSNVIGGTLFFLVVFVLIAGFSRRISCPPGGGRGVSGSQGRFRPNDGHRVSSPLAPTVEPASSSRVRAAARAADVKLAANRKRWLQPPMRAVHRP